MVEKLALSFEVGDPIESRSGTNRRHRLSCELNVAYLMVGATAAAMIIATVLLLAHANPETNRNYQSLTTEAPPNTNTIVDSEMNYRLDFVRNMTRTEWKALLRFCATEGLNNHSWHSGSPEDYDHSPGYEVIQSISTLWVANLQEEFSHAKTWIKPFRQLPPLSSVSGTVTQYVGSMESCYALTSDESFLNGAKEAANVLKKAHQPNGLPWYWAFDDSTYHDSISHKLDQLSPFLEYRYMADLTQDSQLDTVLSKYRKILKSWPKSNGLYISERKNGEAVDSLHTFFYYSRLFYSYLIKSYIQSNYTDHESNLMFNQAIGALESAGLIDQPNSAIHNPDWYYCYLGALFGLSAWAKNRSRDHDDAALLKKHSNWAVQFIDKCHLVTVNETDIMKKDRYLSNHRAECYFVMYRLTGDPKYRDYAWEMAQNINAFVDEADKTFMPPEERVRPEKLMQSTLKYLYLTFAPRNLLSLDEWVFNNDGQPLPICGHNRMYPGNKCSGKLGL